TGGGAGGPHPRRCRLTPMSTVAETNRRTGVNLDETEHSSYHAIDRAPGRDYLTRTVERSTDRILTTHAGSLARPDDLRELLIARDSGRLYDVAAFAARVDRKSTRLNSSH